ncbi:G protein-coupled receptor rhodopsin-like [Trinorchestia longiramus]|nr:G protein-coupled receptor rhodopsin-like [Trinorchestia longiramus]
MGRVKRLVGPFYPPGQLTTSSSNDGRLLPTHLLQQQTVPPPLPTNLNFSWSGEAFRDVLAHNNSVKPNLPFYYPFFANHSQFFSYADHRIPRINSNVDGSSLHSPKFLDSHPTIISFDTRINSSAREYANKGVLPSSIMHSTSLPFMSTTTIVSPASYLPEPDASLSFPSQKPAPRTTALRDKYTSQLTWEEDIVAGTFLVVVGVVALVGNGASVAMFRRKGKKLAPGELLLMNLSFISLMLAGCSYPATMVSLFSHRWIFGELGCQVYGFVCYFLGIANMASVTVLALVRYLKTCSRTAGSRLGNEQILSIIIGIFMFSFGWATIPLLGAGDYDVEPFGTSCTLDWDNPTTGTNFTPVFKAN